MFGVRERFRGCVSRGGQKRKRNDARPRDICGRLFGDRFRGCVSSGGQKRKRNDTRRRGVGGVFGVRERFRGCVSSGGQKRKRNDVRRRGVGGVFGVRERFRGCVRRGGRKRKRDDVRRRCVGAGLFGNRFRSCVPRGGRKRKRNDARWRGVGGVFGGRKRFRRSWARRRRGGWGWAGGARESTELYATARGSAGALVSAAWRERDPTHVHDRAYAFPTQRPVGRGGELSVQTAGR